MNGYKVMNIPFSIVFVIELFSVIDVLQGWKWSGKSKHKTWNWHPFQMDHLCSQGLCVEAWKCPRHSIMEQSTGSCVSWSSEPMVCCMLSNDEGFHYVDTTDIYSVESTEYFNQPDSKFWRETSGTNIDNKYSDEDNLKTPPLDIWDGNSRRRTTQISSLGGFLTTRRPLNKVTNMHFDNTKAPFSHGLRTTGSWNRPSTSEIRIVFPTENSWTPKNTKLPLLTTKVMKRPFDKSTRKTTTSHPWRYTTRVSKTTKSSYFYKPTVTTTYVSEERNRNWGKYTTPRPTRGQTRGTTGTRIIPSVPRTTKKPIFIPYSNKPSLATTTSYNSEEKKNHGWGKYTTSRPTRRFTTNPRDTTSEVTARTTKKAIVTAFNLRTTKRSIITSPIPKTTRGYRTTTVVPNINELSTSSPKNRFPYERIVGGEEAEPFSWPWVVALYKVTSSGGNRFLSAGSLINENFILTAAHVFTPDDLRTASFVVMLGTHDAQDAVAEYLVSSVLQHPRYEQRYYYHDIALLKLNKPVMFNNYVMPVCLPSPDAPLLRDRDLEGKNVTVMGWGDESFGGKSSRVLKEATFPIVSRVSCNASYVKVASNRFPKGITNDMLCAGDPNGGKDACQGDSGGPLTSMEHGRFTQVGIVSFGYKCGDKEYPGVYTKIAPYLTWIAENTRRNERRSYT